MKQEWEKGGPLVMRYHECESTLFSSLENSHGLKFECAKAEQVLQVCWHLHRLQTAL